MGSITRRTSSVILFIQFIGAFYHQQHNWPVVRTLVCDDGRQFKLLTEELALCWVHEGRHYKKLNPYLYAFYRFCWYSWSEQIKSMEKLANYSFEWVLHQLAF